MRPRIVHLLEPLLGRLAWAVVPTYTVMLALGCLLGAVVLVEGARRAGYARRVTLSVVIAAYVAGLGGAWAVPLAQGLYRWASSGRFSLSAGMAAYGGLMGGCLGGLLVLRRRRLPLLPMLDAAAPALGLGYFVARVGCFLAGCDYGLPTTAGVGVVFPPGSHAFRDHLARGLVDEGSPGSLPVHPTQLYLSLCGLALYLATSAIAPRGDGRRFLVYVVGYAALRSLVELFRGDEGRGLAGPVSTSQVLAAVSVALASALVVRARRGVVASAAREASEG